MEIGVISGSSPLIQVNDITIEEAECLRTVYEMIDDDITMKHFRQHSREDLLLISIRSYQCKASSVFRSIKYLQLYATELYPDLFLKVNVARLKPVLDKKVFQLVKTFSDSSPGMLLYRINRWNPSEVSPDEIIAAGMVYIHQLSTISKAAQNNGIIVIVDTEGFNFSHARNSSLSMTKKLMHCICFASPVRMVGHVVFNSHYLVDKIYNVVKYVIPEKLRNEIYIVQRGSPLTPLHNLVPDKNLLPRYLGGEVSNEVGFYEGVENAAMRDTTLQDLIRNIQKEAGKKIID